MNAGEAARILEMRVPAEAEGERLDRFLAARVADVSRAALGRWIREARVSIDGRAAGKTGLRLRAGMEIRLDLPPPASGSARPETIPFRVVYEDEQLIVVDKPNGLTVHPGHGRPGGTLVNGLLGRGCRLSSVGAPGRPGIVHRLDRETSGLLVVAKTDATHHLLARAFATRQVDKRYLALVWGRPNPEDGTVEREIGRSRSNPTKMAVGATRGRPRVAVTHYRTTETMPGFALLEIDLETGRTHQIRVHMESIGHPIVGDDRYGGRRWRGLQDPLRRKAVREFDTLALHAAALGFRHPATGEAMQFVCPIPPAFEGLLAALRTRR